MGLVAGPSDPASPPTPKNRNLPFHGLGSVSSNWAEPSGAPKPDVPTVPSTWQNSGLAPLAGTSTAETIVTLATPSPVSAAGLHLGSAAFAGAAPIMKPASISAAGNAMLLSVPMAPANSQPAMLRM